MIVKHLTLVRTLALVMGHVLEAVPVDVGLKGVEGVGVTGLVTSTMVPWHHCACDQSTMKSFRHLCEA